jgi:hypothetical protein
VTTSCGHPGGGGPHPLLLVIKGTLVTASQSAAPAQMVKEVSGPFPLLTKTNYTDWSTMMRVMLRARGMWTAVMEGAADEVEDQMAMEALLCGVPLEMTASLASKPSAKAAWDQLESSPLSTDRGACRQLSASGGNMRTLLSKTASPSTISHYGLLSVGDAGRRLCAKGPFNTIAHIKLREH